MDTERGWESWRGEGRGFYRLCLSTLFDVAVGMTPSQVSKVGRIAKVAMDLL